MTSIVDSEAHFTKSAEEVGLSDAGRRALLGAGYSTLGRLAFGVGQPGVQMIEAEFQRFATNVLGGMASMQDISAVRRLLFESQTLVMAQLRDLVTNPEAGLTRKLPPVEREAKMRQLKARLPGVVIEKQLEPSHALLNLVSQMWESKQLQYIPIEKLTSREHEVMRSKTVKELSLDTEKLVVKEESKTPDQSSTSEMQVFEALRRRGLALAFCDSMSWQHHERYLQLLFGHLRHEAPEGYVKPSLQQLLKADRQVFMIMIRNDVSVRRSPADILEMDDAIFIALRDYEVGCHLLPLPKSKVSEAKPPAGSSSSYGASLMPPPPQPHPYQRGGKKGRSKGRGKSRERRVVNILPAPLQGKDCVGVDPHGRRLCFDFNIGGCDACAAGAECPKGFHLCCKRGCHAPHSFRDHGKQTKS